MVGRAPVGVDAVDLVEGTPAVPRRSRSMAPTRRPAGAVTDGSASRTLAGREASTHRTLSRARICTELAGPVRGLHTSHAQQGTNLYRPHGVAGGTGARGYIPARRSTDAVADQLHPGQDHIETRIASDPPMARRHTSPAPIPARPVLRPHTAYKAAADPRPPGARDARIPLSPQSLPHIAIGPV